MSMDIGKFIVTILSSTMCFSVPLLLASLGEMFNQRAGVFNLGCEGVMAIGAFIGMVIPFSIGHGGTVSMGWYVLSYLVAALVGALFGLLFGVITVTYRAPQGIAGIGLEMFGVGIAGTLFRIFVGGTQSIPTIPRLALPGLSKIPYVGQILFNMNIVAYLSFLFIPLAWLILFKTPWGLKVRAVGTHPRAADSMGIHVARTRYEALAFGSALAAISGCFLSNAQSGQFSDTMIAGRGFIAVALVYFGHWSPWQILGGALLFTFAQQLQTSIQSLGSGAGFLTNIPYEVFIMLPYILVVLVLAFTSRNDKMSPAALGKPFNREIRT